MFKSLTNDLPSQVRVDHHYPIKIRGIEFPPELFRQIQEEQQRVNATIIYNDGSM